MAKIVDLNEVSRDMFGQDGTLPEMHMSQEAGNASMALYNTARVLCITPCSFTAVMPPVIIEGLTLPGFGTKIKPILNTRVKASCDSCEVVVDFMVQIEPFILSLWFPLCLLKCLSAIAAPENIQKDPPSVLFALQGMMKDLPKPNITDPVKSISIAIGECLKCFTGWSPGKICAMLRDLLDLITAIFKCIKGILEKILTLNVQLMGLMGDPNVHIRKAGDCMAKYIQSQQDMVIVQLNAFSEILKLLQVFFEYVGYALPNEAFTTISNAIAFLRKGNAQVNVGDALGDKNPLNPAIEELRKVIKLIENKIRPPVAWCADNIP